MRQSLTFSKRVEIYNFIKTVGKVVDGYWEYDKEWNDALIATHYKASQHNVAVIRMELGRIKTPTAHLVGPRIARLEERADNIETRMQMHEGKLQGWMDRLNDLERKITSLTLGTKFRVNT